MVLNQPIQFSNPSHDRTIYADISYNSNMNLRPLIIFVHGFKGFKDWGTFNLMAKKFVEYGFTFLKFNGSHNGTTPDHPQDFDDLDAFGHNNFSIELSDLQAVIDQALTRELIPRVKFSSLGLLGHSRGGGLSIIMTKEEPRINSLVTLAALSDFSKILPHDLETWRENEVMYIHNARTNQDMPLYFQLAEDYLQNEKRLNIMNAAREIQQPWLIIHGTDDETVPLWMAEELDGANERAGLAEITNTGHTFGANHPWDSEDMPVAFDDAITRSIRFFKETL